MCRYPDEVVITDDIAGASVDDTSTPSGEPEDDFFSSWDKPAIKRPSNPPSRTGTPPVISRTASPFLNASTANGRAKSPSPLSNAAAEAEKALPAPTAIRTNSSAAIRKGPTPIGGAKRTNILGAKKTSKLGAKKVVNDEIDFDAAEKAAKAEAERIDKLGYDPEAEKVEERKASVSAAKIVPAAASTPLSPPKGGAVTDQRSPGEVERLGMGVARLGFGQVGKPGGTASATATAAPKKMGFGSVGVSKPATDGMLPFAYSPALFH